MKMEIEKEEPQRGFCHLNAEQQAAWFSNRLFTEPGHSHTFSAKLKNTINAAIAAGEPPENVIGHLQKAAEEVSQALPLAKLMLEARNNPALPGNH